MTTSIVLQGALGRFESVVKDRESSPEDIKREADILRRNIFQERQEDIRPSLRGILIHLDLLPGKDTLAKELREQFGITTT